MNLRARLIADAVKARALELGFDRVAIGPAGPPPHAREFEQWLDAGYAGSMTYLARTRQERLDPDRLLPGCRSVVAVALSYRPDDERLPRPEPGDAGADCPPATGPGKAEGDRSLRPRGRRVPGRSLHGRRDSDDPWRLVACYARGHDYHDVMRPRLESLASFIGEAAGGDVRSRAAVDTSAVLERDLAARAGLGWVGRNTNLLSETLGSYFFIGIVLTTAGLEVDAPAPDRCGTCRACLDACPTSAFVEPYVLDARRCLSYLTIEHRGDIDEALRPAVTDWIFGCDVCQDVCPWNRKAPATRESLFAPSDRLGSLDSLLRLDDRAFRERFRGTALMRAKRSGLLRNVALALGNRGVREAIPALRRALADPDPVIREAAAWALDHLPSGTFDPGAHDRAGGGAG